MESDQQSLSDKPLLLVFPFNRLAHYLRCLVLAARLRPYFRILLLHSADYASFIAQEDFETFNCRALDAAYVMQCIKKFSFGWLKAENLEPVFLDQVRIIKELKPYAVLGDQSPTLKMAAEKTGIPYLVLTNGYMTNFYNAPRKISPTHPLYAFLSLLPDNMAAFFTRTGEALTFRFIHNSFKRLRKKYGLKPLKNYWQECEGDLNLIPDLPQLFPLKKLPSYYKVIPPLFYTSADTALAASIQLDKTKKTLLVSMGSSGDWEKVGFLNDACFQQYNVVTAGDAHHLIKGPTVVSLSFVSAEAILPFTDLVICHGGNGTLYQALAYGIPLLCKTSHVEQEWNVQALERKGLGESLDRISTPIQYQKAVERWIDKKDSAHFLAIKENCRSAINMFD
ncbi:MAG: hypothetical protein ICV81_05520, partial [Flavisolibacter sp.]|nr:hypothetical protein [Flavisolibacter sp.]